MYCASGEGVRVCVCARNEFYPHDRLVASSINPLQHNIPHRSDRLETQRLAASASAAAT